jgi:predicted O-methyltransferase YrrM
MILEEIEKIRPASMRELMPKEVFDEADATGCWWAPIQYSYYFAIAKFLKPRFILEIGVLGGASMASMLLGSPKASAVGWDIEAYRKNSNDLAMHTLDICGVSDRVILGNVNSQNESSLPGDMFDLVHVDGEHGFDGAMHDLELAYKANVDTILFDDIFNTNTDCKAASDEFQKRYGSKLANVELIPTQTGLMVFQL